MYEAVTLLVVTSKALSGTRNHPFVSNDGQLLWRKSQHRLVDTDTRLWVDEVAKPSIAIVSIFYDR